MKRLRRALLQNDLSGLSPEELQHLIQDMRMHQIELETEISQLLRRQGGMEILRAKYEHLFDTAPVGYFILDRDGLICDVNAKGALLFNYEKALLTGKNFSSFVHPDDKAVFADHWSCLQKEQESHSCEVRLLQRDGEVFHAWIESGVTEGDRCFGCCRTIVTDISERRRGEDQWRAWSLTDELTGLYNRRGFFTLAEQQLKISIRSERGMTMLSADLDNLKHINDTFGHGEGDLALVGVADILRETFRESDIVARMGGDEFVVLYVETGCVSSGVLARRLRENLAARNAYTVRGYEISLSVGTSFYDPLNPCSVNDLLVQADRAMYSEKSRKKNTRKIRV